MVLGPRGSKMPESLLALFGAPHLIRRYAALHAKSAEILYNLAAATENKDTKVQAMCLTELEGLAEQQTEGRGYVAPPSA